MLPNPNHSQTLTHAWNDDLVLLKSLPHLKVIYTLKRLIWADYQTSYIPTYMLKSFFSTEKVPVV